MLFITILCLFEVGIVLCSTTECFTQGGPAYNGTLNQTAKGEPCLPWSDFIHLRLRKSWNATVMKEQQNYCRNPDDDPRGPWCMVTRAKYGTCAIPHCEHLLDCYNGLGEDYLGDANIAENGAPCISWATALQVIPNRFPTGSLYIVKHMSANFSHSIPLYSSKVESFTSCRNPSKLKSRPWCFTFQLNPSSPNSTGPIMMSPCKLEQCDPSSNLGLPLDFGDECPAGFLTHVGKTLVSTGNEVSTVYCILTAVGMQETETGRFKNFCMFLLNQNRETCPKGFEMKRTFMRTKLKSKSDFSIFRQEGSSSIWLTLCCTNGSHVQARTQYPRFGINSKSHKINSKHSTQSWMNMPNSIRTISKGGTFFKTTSRTKLRKNVAVFASIEKCPAVAGTRRKIFTMGTWKPSNLTTILLQYGYYTSLCIYYDDTTDRNPYMGQNIIPLVPSILVEGKDCPQHFSPASVWETHHLFTYLRTAYILCKPTGIYKDDAIDKLLPNGSQCFISHPQTESNKDENSVYRCPSGFDKNELRWSGSNASNVVYDEVNLLFCCRNGSSNIDPLESGAKAPSPKQYTLPSYLRNVPTFATLMLGNLCPDYMDEKTKLSADFVPVMQTESFLTLELIGQNNPVDFIDSMTGVRGVLALCKYSQQREEVGIVSVNGNCEGIGDRKVSTVLAFPDAGATCAVNVTGINFPLGSYCFYKTSKVCPSGLPELHANLFEGLMRSFLLQTMISASSALNEEKELCCQSEESLSALKLPLNITASFALPAFQSMCQTFVGFTVDQTKGLCEYTPITEPPAAVLVWPRRVFPSNLRGKTEIVLTCSDNEALHSVTMARNFMMRYRNIWLVPSPMQDFSSNDAMELCFTNLQGAFVPSSGLNGQPLDYCVAAFSVCPNENFEMVSVFPYQQYIVCCVKRQQQSHTESSTDTLAPTMWPENIRSIVTLGRKRPGDEEKVKDLAGPTELHRDLQQTMADDGCPAFDGFSLIRRYVKMWRPRRYKNLWVRHTIQQLLNITSSSMKDEDAIANRTGMWLQDGLLHTIFCEFHTLRPAEARHDTVWPLENYAIPKPVTGCPPQFKSTEFVHLQGRNGFHYSQPIHLAGDFISHSRAVKLQYCKREAATPWSKRYAAPLPAGHYCLLLVGRRCPSGFTAGSLFVLEGLLRANETDSNSTDSSLIHQNITQSPPDSFNSPRIFRDKVEKGDSGLTFDRVTYMFCCRADSPSASIAITGFPSKTGPFYLYRAGETCQVIAGLRATEEYICMDAPEFLVGKVLPFSFHMEIVDKTYHIEGFTPTLSLSSDHCNVKINLCYYEPTVDEKEVTIVEQNNGSAWPAGSYSLVTTIRKSSSTACPPGFYLDIRTNIRPEVIANTFFRPMSFAEYFTQTGPSDDLFNTSMPTLHTCRRNATDKPSTYNLAAFPSWPPGNYCVLMDLETRSCPQDLHRYTRQLAELCCHTETTNTKTPVKLPFAGDFFLMGAFDEPDLACLPIENAHVEKYVVMLFSSVEPHIHSLCHYLPIEWLKKTRQWPKGDYLLPIGKRGLQLPSVSTASLLQENVVLQKTSFSCPTGFQRLVHEYEMFDEDFGESTEELVESGTKVTLNFCQRQQNEKVDETEAEKKEETDKTNTWPMGDYCVIVMGAICPLKMHASNELVMRVPRSYLKSIRKTNDYGEPEGENMHTGEGVLNVTYYSVCCREDKMLLVDLPSFSGGMYMPAGSSLCSSIPGTFIEHEQVTTYLDPTLLDPYVSGDSDLSHFMKQRWMPAPFEEPGIMTLCYYHQMQQLPKGSLNGSSSNMLYDLLEPGTTSLSLWLAGECGCAENAYCRPFKRFSCKCKDGTFGDGIRICREVTPFTDSCANLCHESAECKTRRKHSFVNRIKEETACVCKDGFVGDGFHCLPQCSAHSCQPYSRCKIKRGVPTCECVPGTIQDGERCNFDIYSSLQAEKDLPQYMLQHLACFDDTVMKALIRQEPKLFFVLFAPLKLLKTCSDIRSHIVSFPDKKSYEAFVNTPFSEQPSLNGSLIQFNVSKGVRVNGEEVVDRPILFTNGRVYYVSDKLKFIPTSAGSGFNGMGLGISLVVILLLVGIIVGVIFMKRRRPELFRFHIFSRGPRFQRVSMPKASWRGSTGVLVASDELDQD